MLEPFDESAGAHVSVKPCVHVGAVGHQAPKNHDDTIHHRERGSAESLVIHFSVIDWPCASADFPRKVRTRTMRQVPPQESGESERHREARYRAILRS